MQTEVLPEARSRWEAVEYVVDFGLRARNLGMLAALINWVIAVRFFREAESERMYLQEPSDTDRLFHQAIVGTLIGEGQRLLAQIRLRGGLPENELGMKTQDVDAMVEELENTRVQWYGDMTEERRQGILKEVFRAEAP
jgi:hypothetical protein